MRLQTQVHQKQRGCHKWHELELRTTPFRVVVRLDDMEVARVYRWGWLAGLRGWMDRKIPRYESGLRINKQLIMGRKRRVKR